MKETDRSEITLSSIKLLLNLELINDRNFTP